MIAPGETCDTLEEVLLYGIAWGSPDAAEVYMDALECSGLRDRGLLRRLSVGVVAEVLVRGLMVAGEFTEAGFRRWDCSTDTALWRIIDEWLQLDDEVPTPGAVAWFNLTLEGETLAAGLQRRYEGARRAAGGHAEQQPGDLIGLLAESRHGRPLLCDVDRELLVAGLAGPVDAAEVYRVASRCSELTGATHRRQLALGVVAELLARGVVVAGDTTEEGFRRWGGPAKEVIVRIVDAWLRCGDAAPAPGAVVSLALTAEGSATAERFASGGGTLPPE